jgi:hypothetical protein
MLKNYVSNLKNCRHSLLGRDSTCKVLNILTTFFFSQDITVSSASNVVDDDPVGPQMMDIVDMAIQVGGAKEGQPFILKI